MSPKILNIFQSLAKKWITLDKYTKINVKFVPYARIVGEAKAQGCKFYQYTAIDEYSHWRYAEAFEEHGSYSSMRLSA